MRAEEGSTDTPPARRLGRRGLAGLAAEVALIGVALPLYYLVRGLSHERVAVAFDHANQLIDLEKALGIFCEADLQDQVLSYGWLVDTLNAMYLYGHLPVVLVIAIWLYLRHRPQYLLMRNAFLISGAIGLIVYVSFPVAPPRLMPEELGFTDTVFRQYGVSRVAMVLAERVRCRPQPSFRLEPAGGRGGLAGLQERRPPLVRCGHALGHAGRDSPDGQPLFPRCCRRFAGDCRGHGPRPRCAYARPSLSLQAPRACRRGGLVGLGVLAGRRCRSLRRPAGRRRAVNTQCRNRLTTCEAQA